MKKLLLVFFFFFVNTTSFAAAPEFSKYFAGKSGCFVLFSLQEHKIIAQYNYLGCEERLSPDSTFKIPLSLMAFDEQIITPDSVFKWDGKIRSQTAWNRDQTPQTWLQNSTVWVSQELTPKLGMTKIKDYLKQINYGNQDFSGTPGKEDGLTTAWLNSSLKISGDEQLIFLTALVNNKLPFSEEAIRETKKNMFMETSANGWKLYGKTGSDKDVGWFIGYIEKAGQTYIFVLNYSDLVNTGEQESHGLQAKVMTKNLLGDLGIF